RSRPPRARPRARSGRSRRARAPARRARSADASCRCPPARRPPPGGPRRRSPVRATRGRFSAAFHVRSAAPPAQLEFVLVSVNMVSAHGRHAEVEAIERVVGAADPALLVLRGPGGIGKSRLLSVAGELARARGVRVLD